MVLRTDTSSKSAITTAAPAGFKCGGRGPFCECQPGILGFLLKLLVMQTQVRDCLVASLDGLTGIRLHRLRFSGGVLPSASEVCNLDVRSFGTLL